MHMLARNTEEEGKKSQTKILFKEVVDVVTIV